MRPLHKRLTIPQKVLYSALTTLFIIATVNSLRAGAFADTGTQVFAYLCFVIALVLKPRL